MDASAKPENELSQTMAECPLRMKLGSNLCFCAPWFKQNKRWTKRMRQTIAKKFTQEDCDAYLLHLIPHAATICKCAYGNYMIQEIMERSTTTAVQIFISSCPIADIMMNGIGSRVVESLTEMHGRVFVPLIFNRISRMFGRLARDSYANYGVKKLCEHMPLENFGTVMRAALTHASRLAMNAHGAYVIQTILQRMDEAAERGFLINDSSLYPMFETLLNNLIAGGPRMIQHPIGNFTVQAMVGVLHWYPSAEAKFVNGVCEHIVMYVACRFGTRVAESILESGSAYAKQRVIKRLLDLNDAEFSYLMRGKNAQYLYGKVLACVDTRQRAKFDEMLNVVLAESANPYAVGLMVDETFVPTFEKGSLGNSSYGSEFSGSSSTSSSGDDDASVEKVTQDKPAMMQGRNVFAPPFVPMEAQENGHWIEYNDWSANPQY